MAEPESETIDFLRKQALRMIHNSLTLGEEPVQPQEPEHQELVHQAEEDVVVAGEEHF